MYSYGTVFIIGQQGTLEQDTTGALIRLGLQHVGGPRDMNKEQHRVNNDVPLTSPGTEYNLVTKYVISHDYLPEIPDSGACPRSRAHSRLVMKTYGWPIKFAKNLPEFVGAMRDAIIGTSTICLR